MILSADMLCQMEMTYDLSISTDAKVPHLTGFGRVTPLPQVELLEGECYESFNKQLSDSA